LHLSKAVLDSLKAFADKFERLAEPFLVVSI
jgi:hypothetical protein